MALDDLHKNESSALKRALEENDGETVIVILGKASPPEAAELLHRLDRGGLIRAFNHIPEHSACQVFSYLNLWEQQVLIDHLDDHRLRVILADLSPDDRTGLLARLDATDSQRLLNLLEPDDLEVARDLLAYPKESVGRLMSTSYLAASADWTVGRALQHFREYGQDTETVNMIYVIDQEGRLIDDIRLRRFIFSDPERQVRDLMDGEMIALDARDDRERAVALMKRYDVVALPVVDDEQHLLGIVTIDDVFDVADEEMTEDMHKSSAMQPLGMSYRRATVFTLFQRRFYWLALLVVLNLASSGIIAAYEQALEAAVALAFFIPLLIDSGGNSGSQAATMMIRAMVTGEIHMRDWGRTVIKELGVGILLGCSLAVLAAVLGIYRGGPEIGLIVGLSMIAIIVFSNIIGMSLPFVLHRVKVDPAAASSPLVTSICDSVGLLIYFGIATTVLPL